MAVTTKNNIVRMTASLDTYTPGGKTKIRGVRLVAGIDAATAILRATDGSGAVLYSSKAAAAGVDESVIPWQSQEALHLTMTGTSPELFIYLE